MRKLPIRKSAGIGLVYKNSICLCKRIYKFEGKPVEFGGYWSIFGGEIEKGETEAECAIRELYEESSVRVDPHQLVPIKTIEHDVSSFCIFAFLHFSYFRLLRIVLFGAPLRFHVSGF